ncbi:CYTH domain-containing protein [Alkalihalobacillus sp. FSL W8-0930]
MAQELEFETKTLVFLDEFHALHTFFQTTNQEAITQHNHYFETPAFALKEAGSALRIREKHKKSTLTLKQPALDGGLLETHQSITEDEQKVAIKEGKLPDGEVLQRVSSLQIHTDDLKFIGTLTTDRLEFPYDGGTVCLDKSSYHGVIDYELEFEGTSMEHAEQVITSILKKTNIQRKKTPNKVARFFAQKETKRT